MHIHIVKIFAYCVYILKGNNTLKIFAPDFASCLIITISLIGDEIKVKS